MQIDENQPNEFNKIPKIDDLTIFELIKKVGESIGYDGSWYATNALDNLSVTSDDFSNSLTSLYDPEVVHNFRISQGLHADDYIDKNPSEDILDLRGVVYTTLKAHRLKHGVTQNLIKVLTDKDFASVYHNDKWAREVAADTIDALCADRSPRALSQLKPILAIYNPKVNSEDLAHSAFIEGDIDAGDYISTVLKVCVANVFDDILGYVMDRYLEYEGELEEVVEFTEEYDRVRDHIERYNETGEMPLAYVRHFNSEATNLCFKVYEMDNDYQLRTTDLPVDCNFFGYDYEIGQDILNLKFDKELEMRSKGSEFRPYSISGIISFDHENKSIAVNACPEDDYDANKFLEETFERIMPSYALQFITED